ncbi:MAG: ATP-grasp domain-containing protein [Clostridia bacterium]|nr:ATP-grasp domain-containing protein [Clostridia bacterium]
MTEKSYDVAVVFGGVSSENEVSVITGTMACNVLKKGGKSVLPVYIDHDGVMRADEGLADISVYKKQGYVQFAKCGFAVGAVVLFNKSGKPKRAAEVGAVLNCCHGGAGEGGGLAGLCAMLGIPFASAGLFESAAFMDKYYTKLVLQSLGAKTAKFFYSRDIKGAIEGANAVGYPVIVKPATLGSSIGIAKCEDDEELESALETAFELDDGVLCEEYLSNRREINCAAYFADGKVITSPCEEVASAGEVLSYDDKYCGGGKRLFPAPLDEDVAIAIRKETARVYTALNMRGVVRFDYILSGGEIYISEINTVPGSLSQYLLSESYADFNKVLSGVIKQAKTDFAARKSKRIISTGILNDITAVTNIKK